MSPARQSRADDGFTLIELIVAISIMGIAMVFIVAGMTTSIFASDVHRTQAQAETIVRAFAEQVKNTTCNSTCPTSYAYAGTLPTGYSMPTAVVHCGVAGATGNNAFPDSPPCPAPDVLQKVTLSVSSTDGRDSESVEIVKRQP